MKELTFVADRGYFKDEEIVECEKAAIATLVPNNNPLTSPDRAKGFFDKSRYRSSPATIDGTLGRRARYWASACSRCPLKACCTDNYAYRRISRWEHAT